MSSISVLWRRSAEPSIEVLAEAMLSAQVPHGPDASFLFCTPHIAMGGNRMDLLPEDCFDRQPLWTPDRSAYMVADVRLDNRAELARKLELTGVDQLADSAFLLEAWRRWGEGCLDHIAGAFAFAVWTPARQEIFAARDHVGDRPLFYFRDAEQFALATVPAGLLALPGVGRAPDEARIVDWMSLTQPDWTKSFYADVHRMPPGHSLRVTPERLECKSYWHPCDAKPLRYKRDSEYADAFVEVMQQATKARLRSSGEVGAQLSAGLDSGTVVGLAAPLLAAGGRRLTAYTYVPQAGFLGKGSPGRLVNEAAGAADVARMYSNVDHRLIDTAGEDLLGEMKAWSDLAGEPMANSINLLWFSAILKEAKSRGTGVMLQGFYGNLTFSQEGRDNLQTWFRQGRWVKLCRFANSLRNHGHTSFRASFLQATNSLLPMALRRRLSLARGQMHLNYSSLSPDVDAKHRPMERALAALHGPEPDLRTQRKLFFERFDLGAINAATRAYAGIDPRDPAGDKRVFEFCFGIPPEQYAVGYEARSLVRRAMRGRLPETTLTRYARGQQGVDWYVSVKRALPALREELGRMEQSALVRELVDVPRLKRLLESWPETGYETAEVYDEWNFALTRGIALGYFLRGLEVKS